MLRLIRQHEEVVAGRDKLARAHELPTPGTRAFLFGAAALRSRECELLQDRLRVEYGTGGIAERPTQGAPPVGFVPA